MAGDLLPDARVEDRVATGFHRNTLTNREGGVNEEQTRFEEVVDRANTIGTVWLGLTVGCAQCHDHKYDPITQKDYYQFFAFFDNSKEGLIDAPVAGELGPWLRTYDEYRRKRQELLTEYRVPELEPGFYEKLAEAAKNPGKWTDWDLAYASLAKATDDGPEIFWMQPTRRSQRQQDTLTEYFVQWSHFAYGAERYKELRFAELWEKLEQLKASYPQLTQARVVFEDPEPHPSQLRVRGDYKAKGIAVEPDSPGFLPALVRDSPKDHASTRLDLARWLVSRDNPLTARVTVNRMWQEFFGKGIVRTSDDFGTQGEPPTHPELLDWLASEFMDSGWKMKRLHKLFVMSAAYRQSSHTRPDLHERDPNNALLARQSRLRLPAEMIRDNVLAVSGLLYPKIGGPSVRPPQPEAVSKVTYGKGNEWKTSDGKDRYRRGLYIHFQRTSPYPLLMNFDAPDSNVSCTRRLRSNTPLQALNTLNDPVFLEAAQALALRILTGSGPKREERLAYAFELCLSRQPTAFEREQVTDYLDKQKTEFAAHPQSAVELSPIVLPGNEPVEFATWVGLSRSLINLDEFITRE
jgi:hypothetical protein